MQYLYICNEVGYYTVMATLNYTLNRLTIDNDYSKCVFNF